MVALLAAEPRLRGPAREHVGRPAATRAVDADREGRCAVGQLDPAAALHLTVLDDVGTVLHEEALAPLGAEERRVVRVSVAMPLGDVRGRVVSESGEPLAWASASLAGADAGTRTAQADGRFRFSRVADGEHRLTVTMPGFVPCVLERVRPSPEELELVLVRGPDLTVRVRTASGRPYALGDVRVKSSDEPRWHEDPWILADARGDGLFELSGLPEGEREIVFECPAGVLRQTWTPPQAEVVFFVPAGAGTVEVSQRGGAAFPSNCSVRVESRGGGNPREIALDSATGGVVRFEQFEGDYELVLEVEQTLGANFTQRSEVTRRPFTVVDGETVRIELP